MQIAAESYDVGVIVGRFQVHELHAAHIDLIQHVVDAHDKVIVLLGCSPLMNTANNPLDFEARKQMFLEKWPNLNVLYARDNASDVVWSQQIDETIRTLLTAGQTAVLYGGRDSFANRYHGSFPTRELEQTVFLSGTALRRGIAAASTVASSDFRAGVVWASSSRFPTAYTTVDVAVFNEDKTKILLGRKPGESKYRFIGGFSDPRSPSLEADGKREVTEEANIETDNFRYVASMLVDDWRYQGEQDRIKTTLWVATYIFGSPQAGDDLEEVRWFEVDPPPFVIGKQSLLSSLRHQLEPVHHPLLEALSDYFIGEEY